MSSWIVKSKDGFYLTEMAYWSKSQKYADKFPSKRTAKKHALEYGGKVYKLLAKARNWEKLPAGKAGDILNSTWTGWAPGAKLGGPVGNYEHIKCETVYVPASYTSNGYSVVVDKCGDGSGAWVTLVSSHQSCCNAGVDIDWDDLPAMILVLQRLYEKNQSPF